MTELRIFQGSRPHPARHGGSPDARHFPPAALCPQESMRKVFPLNLGGSDTCYFCRKRVYVMERLSAEGHFFHRECFRCSVCATTLRLAAYAFDGDEGNSQGPGTALLSGLGSCPLEALGRPSASQGMWRPRGSCSRSWEILLEREATSGGPGRPRVPAVYWQWWHLLCVLTSIPTFHGPVKARKSHLATSNMLGTHLPRNKGSINDMLMFLFTKYVLQK